MIMEPQTKNDLMRLVFSITPVLLIIIVLSTPLGLIPPIGNLINPNGGIWDISTYAEHGSKTLTIPGVEEEVICYYDEWGIPHIFAETDNDMFFTIGYVHARDRLFQLDMVRRLFTGRVSEIMGEQALPSDIQMRNLCLERSALETWNLMLDEDPDSSLISGLNSYASGINYYIDHLTSHELPLEFRLLNYKPSPWLSHHTIAYGKYMALGLAHDGFREFIVALLETSFSETEMFELFPLNNTAGIIPVLPNYGNYSMLSDSSSSIKSLTKVSENSISPEVKNSIIQILNAEDKAKQVVIDKNNGFTVEDYSTIFEAFIGSNNWVIDGNISDTGYPILANDMHLQLVMPSVWYEMQHASAESGINVYGFSFVGAAGVIAGHTNYASWGFTNVGADVVDYYYYEESDDGKQFLNGTVWQDYKVLYDNIPVKGSEDYNLTLRFTGHGPIISPDISSVVEEAGFAPISMRWTGHDDLMYGTPDYLFKAVQQFWKCQTLSDFVEAQKDWGLPGQNLAIATTDGHIAIRPVANYPIRPAGNWGRSPKNGSDPANDWLGYIPYNELPVAHDPNQHFLSSTNQKTAGPDYPYFLGSFFAPGYRSRSITKLIQDKIVADEKISVEDMQRFQSSIIDTSVDAFQPVWSTIDTKGNSTLQAALDYMLNWGGSEYSLGEMHRDIVAPTIFTEWLEFFRVNVFADEYAEADVPDRVRNRYPQDNVLENMTMFNQSVGWFNDVSTPELEIIDDIAYKSLADAVDYLTSRRGLGTPNMDQWFYGEYHQLYPLHLTGLGPYNAGPYPFYGNAYTLAAATGRTVHHGSSERAVYSLDPSIREITHAWTSIPGGQNGNPLSKHYKDQMELLYINRTHDKFGYHLSHYYQTAAEFKLAAGASKSDKFHIESTLILRSGG
jgi:penicillin amidase